VGVEGLTFVRIAIEIWELVRVALNWEAGSGWVSEGSSVWATGFCGPCVCLSVFLL
jgi:hypothetical protein